ncbi:MAG: hypothetical protein LUE27_06420 [Clostridia bacterium]|nr:hypothetical protein [Clostridia bacterium]
MTDENKIQQERVTIDFMDFFLFALRRWRIVIVLAVVCALLLGGAKLAVNATRGHQAALTGSALESAQETIADDEATIASDQVNMASYQSQVDDLYAAVERYEALLEQVESGEMTETTVADIISLTDAITTSRSTIASREATMEKGQMEIDTLTEEIAELTEQINGMQRISLRSGVVRRAVYGFVGGILLAAVYLLIRYCADKSVRSEEYFTDQLGLNLLSTLRFPVKKGKKRWCVDRWLDRAAGDYSDIPPEGQYELAAAMVQVLFPDKDRILVAGTLDSATLEAFCQGVQEHLPENGCTLVPLGNPMASAEAMLQVQSGPVVLAERIHHSGKRAMADLVRFLCLSGADLRGVVSLRGVL